MALSIPQADTLRAMGYQGHPVTRRQVGRLIRQDDGVTARILDALFRRGLVTIDADGNGAGPIYVLTRKGWRRYAATWMV